MSGGGVYLDSSAFVKLIVAEPESQALARDLAGREIAVSSEILEIEALRAAARVGSAALARAPQRLAAVALISLTADIRRSAGALGPPELRSLDAIHLTTALSLAEDLEAVLTYDTRLATAAANAGLRVEAPA